MTRLTLTTPRFSFARLVESHGWAWLAPFVWEDRPQTLARPITLKQGRPVHVRIRTQRLGSMCQVSVTCDRDIDSEERQVVRDGVRRMLRLDEDFTAFHQFCAEDRRLSYVTRSRCGGMLRGPDLLEDLIKTVCTVNCSWSNTTRMCERLCDLHNGAFPTGRTLLRFSERQLAARTSLGYRAKTVRMLARMHEEGKLPLDHWAVQGDFERIRATLKPIWGIGPYALNHILVLLGCYESIPVDSEVIQYLRETHFKGNAVSAQEAVKPYERYGNFRFLAYKFGRMVQQ